MMNENLDCDLGECIGNGTNSGENKDAVTNIQNEQPREEIRVPVADPYPTQAIHKVNFSEANITPETVSKLNVTLTNNENTLNLNPVSSTQIIHGFTSRNMSTCHTSQSSTSPLPSKSSTVVTLKKTKLNTTEVLVKEGITNLKPTVKSLPLSSTTVISSAGVLETNTSRIIETVSTTRKTSSTSRLPSTLTSPAASSSTTKTTTQHSHNTETSPPHQTVFDFANEGTKHLEFPQTTNKTGQLNGLQTSSTKMTLTSTTTKNSIHLVPVLNMESRSTQRPLTNASVPSLPANLTKTETNPSSQFTMSTSKAIYVLPVLLSISVLIVLIVIFIYTKKRREHQGKHLLNTSPDYIENEYPDKDMYSKVDLTKKNLNHNSAIIEEIIPLNTITVETNTHSSGDTSEPNMQAPLANMDNEIFVDNEIYEGANSSSAPSETVKAVAVSDSSTIPRHDYQSVPSISHDYQSLPSTSHDYQSVPSTAHDYQSVPSTSHDYQSVPSTSHDYHSVPSTSHDYQSVPSTSQECESAPSSTSVPVMQTITRPVIDITEYLIPACHRHPPQGPNWRPYHDYDPVYVPTSSASAMNRFVDSTGYISRPRPDSPILEVYEEINYGAVAAPPLKPRLTMGATASGGRPARSLPVPPPVPQHQPFSHNNNNVTRPTYTLQQPTITTSQTDHSDNSLNVNIPVAASSRNGYAGVNVGDTNQASRVSCASSSTSREEPYESVDLLKHDT